MTSFEEQIDLEARLRALQDSEELCLIYNHPHWIKLMELVKAAQTGAKLRKLREWTCKHSQLGPLLIRFDQCAKMFGLTIDPFVFVPPSRLQYKQHCEKQLLFHQKEAAEHQRQAEHFRQVLRGMSANSESSPVPQRAPSILDNQYKSESSLRSCFGVLSEEPRPRIPTYQAPQPQELPRPVTPDWNIPSPFAPTDSLFHEALYMLPPPAASPSTALRFGRPL